MSDETYSATSGNATSAGVWAAYVTIDGVDQTARVVGEIRIDAEEGAARIADLTLRPAAGTAVTVAAWVGKSVAIEIGDVATGQPVNIRRLFGGLIDTPTLDLVQRTIHLRCTDNLQNVIEALNNAEIDALTPNGWHSPVIFDPASSGWVRLQDRLSTIPYACELNVDGTPRVTAWTPKIGTDMSFTPAHLLDGSVSVSLAPRHQLVNEIAISFAYRFPRVKAECYPLTYAYVAETNIAAHAQNLNWWLGREVVVSAIEAAGGTIEAITYTPLPNQTIGSWTPGPDDFKLCMGFSAQVSFDYAQTIEERHAITVYAPNAQAAVGVLRSTLQGALEGGYPPLQTAEHSALLFKNSISGIPPLDAASPVVGYTTSSDVSLTPDTNRAAANMAMQTLIQIAKCKVWGTHRRNYVRAAVPLNPFLDLDRTIEVSAGVVHARGKCHAVSHRLNPATGEAVSEFTLAICTAAGVGVTHNDTPTTAPTGSSPASTLLSGMPSANFAFLPGEDHRLTVTFPGVEAAERAKAVIPIVTSYDAMITEDLLEIVL